MSRTVLCVDTDRRVSSVASTIDADDELTAVEATSLEQAAATLEREPIVGVVTAYELADGTGWISSNSSESRHRRRRAFSLPTSRRVRSTPHRSKN